MGTLTRADLAVAVAHTHPSLSPPQGRALVEEVLEEIAEALVRGDNVRLRGFAAFRVRAKGPRVGRNPKSPKEAYAIAPRRVVTFSASQNLCAKIKEATR